jgi:hypothetical protein
VIPRPARPRRATYCWVTQRGKIRYRTRKDAKAARAAALGRRPEAEQLRIYKCPTCDGFHLTSLRTPPQPRTKAPTIRPEPGPVREHPAGPEAAAPAPAHLADDRLDPAGPVSAHVAGDRSGPAVVISEHLAVSGPAAPGSARLHLVASAMPAVPTPLTIRRRP